jgi:hypothetical protein
MRRSPWFQNQVTNDGADDTSVASSNVLRNKISNYIKTNCSQQQFYGPNETKDEEIVLPCASTKCKSTKVNLRTEQNTF